MKTLLDEILSPAERSALCPLLGNLAQAAAEREALLEEMIAEEEDRFGWCEMEPEEEVACLAAQDTESAEFTYAGEGYEVRLTRSASGGCTLRLLRGRAGASVVLGGAPCAVCGIETPVSVSHPPPALALEDREGRPILLRLLRRV